ncbi:hypothetical protein [Haloarchaeobius sp. DFWS5]|uniref:hypothetical protein n=1 Tax=Haloarchaeobius sp. DFWS5 TaxID=3446114 RepID=UPI003EB84DE6
MTIHIVEERDGRFVVDHWEGTELDSWSRRTTVVAEPFPATVGVGDVLEVEDSLYGLQAGDDAPVISHADEATADRIKEEYEVFEERLREYAAEYGVDFDAGYESLADGDFIFVATPPQMRYFPVRDFEVGYVFPGGIYADGAETSRRFANLVHCPESVLESGMAFDVVELDDLVYGLRYDERLTEDVQSQSPKIQFYFSDFAELGDDIESKDDLEHPLYVLVDGFDDGQYYSSLYESAPSGRSHGFQNYREFSGGSARTPYHIPKHWPYVHGDGLLIPVDEMYLDTSGYEDTYVAVLSRDADPVKPERK